MREVISIHIGQAGIQVRGNWLPAASHAERLTSYELTACFGHGADASSGEGWPQRQRV